MGGSRFVENRRTAAVDLPMVTAGSPVASESINGRLRVRPPRQPDTSARGKPNSSVNSQRHDFHESSDDGRVTETAKVASRTRSAIEARWLPSEGNRFADAFSRT